MPVVCSEGGEFATVDHLEPDNRTIKLARDEDGKPQSTTCFRHGSLCKWAAALQPPRSNGAQVALVPTHEVEERVEAFVVVE
jgi:hypothetical protein